jgi:hypothetical protein
MQVLARREPKLDLPAAAASAELGNAAIAASPMVFTMALWCLFTAEDPVVPLHVDESTGTPRVA